MSGFSGRERRMARFLGRYPFIKGLAKKGYTRLVYWRSKKAFKCQTYSEVVPYALCGQSSFFGYYDHSPENNNGYVLAHVSELPTNEKPTCNESIKLVVFDQAREPVIQIAVRAYNWQQGSRAHWLTDDLFMFNDFDDQLGYYASRVWSVSGCKEVLEFSRPVQDSFGVVFFLSINYRRIMALRPDYGYRNLPPMGQEELEDLAHDGIWRVEFSDGSDRLVVSLSSVLEVSERPSFEKAVHELNHVSVSPAGKEFIFIHRWVVGGRSYGRLMGGDCQTGEVRVLADHDMVSHCFWATDELVVGYLRGPDGRDGYWIVDTGTGEIEELACAGLEGMGDGHPHVVGDWFVTDTYPDKARMQHLMLGNWRTGEVREIGEFFHGFEFEGESRCDLHPRLSSDGKRVYFDSVFSGERKLYRLDL